MPTSVHKPAPAEPRPAEPERQRQEASPVPGPRGSAQARAVRSLQSSPRMLAQRQTLQRLQRGVMQRAIGLEIEVPVPIDQLPVDQTAAIEALAGPPAHDAPLKDRIEAAGRAAKAGRARYGTLVQNDKVRVDVDHDDRVKTPDPLGAGWPLAEGGEDSIVEIITQPARNSKAFDACMDEVDQIVNDIQTQTGTFTRHWVNAWGTGHNVGPLDYASQGRPARRMPQHNFDGSVQVNLGVGLTGYGDILETYAKSDYADPQRARPEERKSFEDANQHILAATEAGRNVAEQLRAQYAKKLGPGHNGLRGVEGWLTHVALYLIRGSAQGVGGTKKNLAPVLLKSPSSVAAEHGMTEAERDFYASEQNTIMTTLLEAVNRHKDAKWFGRWKERQVFPQQSPDQGGDVRIGDLASIEGGTDDVLLAGTPIADPKGSSDMVVEFRTLPGYHQPDQWRKLGKDFLAAAKSSKKPK